MSWEITPDRLNGSGPFEGIGVRQVMIEWLEWLESTTSHGAIS